MYVPADYNNNADSQKKKNPKQTEPINVDFCTRNAVILAIKTVQHTSDTPLLFIQAVFMHAKDEFTLIGTY